MCCPNTDWGRSFDRNGVVQNRSCCLVGKDCAGFCLPTQQGADPVYTTDFAGTCCQTVELDCNKTCPALNAAGQYAPISVLDQFGGACLPA